MNINLINQQDIVEHYGVSNQLGIYMEECAELIQAISKINREFNGGVKISNEAYSNLVEEIADVIVCIDQLQFIFDISDEAIIYNANNKIKRQKWRVSDEV